MIEKTQSIPHWSDEEHRTILTNRLVGRGLQGKWITLQEPVLRRTYVGQWDRFLTEVRAAARPSLPPSDDELFQQAAAKVNHRIQMNRKILGGAPCIAGTRVPVYAILQLVEAGYSHKKLLKSFPSLSQEDLEAALRFSAIVMER